MNIFDPLGALADWWLGRPDNVHRLGFSRGWTSACATFFVLYGVAHLLGVA